jgi:hypothetical protein
MSAIFDEDGEVVQEKRFPLLAILIYCAYLEKGNSKKKLMELGGIVGRKKLANFLEAQSKAGSRKLYDHFQPIVTKRRFFWEAPEHIKGAIREIYPEYITAFALSDTEFLKVFDVEAKFNNDISENYTGVWNVIRYAAFPVEDRNGKAVIGVVRAAMEIFPRSTSKPNSVPTFTVNYKPWRSTTITEVTGSIFSVLSGQHMAFFGRDQATGYPLDIFAEQVHVKPQDFLGFVKRKHENGLVFVSRVKFVRPRSRTTSLADLKDKIGILPMDEFKERNKDDFEDLSDILLEVRNNVKHQAQTALFLV